MSSLQGSVALSELASCSEEERQTKINSLFQAALQPTEDQVHEQKTALNKRISVFERRYEMSSEDMQQQLCKGKLKETADICSWALLLKSKDSFDTESSSSRTDSI
ncbi:MAG: hypothetical protein ABG776_12525 [Cyanobacteria bacterium J06555_13]